MANSLQDNIDKPQVHFSGSPINPEKRTEEEADVSQKSIAMILDEFVTNQIRCWFAQEENLRVNRLIEKGELDAESPEAHRLKANAADTAQQTNKLRNRYHRAINKYFGDPNNVQLKKSYDTEAPESSPLLAHTLKLESMLAELSYQSLHTTDTHLNHRLAQEAEDYLKE